MLRTKLTGAFLAVLMAAGAFLVSAPAQAASAGATSGLAITVSVSKAGGLEAAVKSKLGSEKYASITSLTVTGAINDGTDLVFIGTNMHGLKTLDLGGASLSTIGANRFNTKTSYLSGTTLILPKKGLASIGSGAFNKCRLTGSLAIPPDVTAVGSYAFADNNFTGTLTLPSALQTVGQYAFFDAGFIGSLTIPAKMTAINNDAFEFCDFSSLTLPAGVQSIGAYAFSSNGSLAGTVAIPSSVKTVGECAFMYDWHMEWVAVSKVPTYGYGCFAFCAMDFSTGKYPPGITAGNVGSYAYGQIPRVYLSLSSSSTSVKIGAKFSIPKPTVRTKNGTDYTALQSAALDSNNAWSQWLFHADGFSLNTYCACAASVVGSGATKISDITTQHATTYTVTYTLSDNLPAGYPVQSIYSDIGKVSYRLTVGSGNTPVGGISFALDKSSITLTAGWTDTLIPIFTPDYATDQGVIWTSSNANVATVNNGKITAVGAGTASITGTAKGDTTKKAVCKVTVTGFIRLSGDDRIGTAIAISKKGWTSSGTVYLAYSGSFPDAAAAVPLAAVNNAPILLTDTAAVSAGVLAEIKRLGAKHIFLLGGAGVISDGVVNQLKGLKYNVGRLAGDNRAATAAAIGGRVVVATKTTTAVIVTGADFPDALVIAPYAGIKGFPVLYTNQASLPAETSSFLSSWKITNVILLSQGGDVDTARVTAAIKMAGVKTVDKVTGNDRYDLSAVVATQYKGSFGNGICVATGLNYPDALAGGAFAAKMKMPLLLVNPSSGASASEKKYAQALKTPAVYVFGGTGVVPDNVVTGIGH